MTPAEIDIAIQRGFDGTLDEAGCLELRAILKSDSAARALYYEHAGLHQALIYRLTRHNVAESAKALTNARVRMQTLRSVRFAIIAAAAAVVVLGLILKMIFVPEKPVMATFRNASGSIFTLKHSDSNKKPKPGELAENSTMHLTQGSLEIQLRNGTRAMVLAPAAFGFHSDTRMFLTEGTAWFHVSKEGQGFQVTTPEMLVTDLGTKFGVVTHPGRSDEVHVFTGHVRAKGSKGLKTEVSLTEGQAMVCNPIGRFMTVAVRPEEFLTTLPAKSHAGLIANGGFEAGNPPPDGEYGVPATAALLPFWKFGKNISVALKTDTVRLGYGLRNTSIVSSTADVQVGFNDDADGQPTTADVTISQTFETVPGTRYEVAFEMGAIFFSQYPMEITASVHADTDAGPLLGQQIERRAPSQGNGYNPPTRFTFTATSTASTLVFVETSANSLSADPTLDNITVTALPQESPATR